MFSSNQLRIMHIISGDLWAGAEVQAYTLLKNIQTTVHLHVVLMNEGELANRLRAENIQITVLPETQLSSFTILKSMISLIRQFKPSIIHTHRQKENILGNIANIIAFPSSRDRPKSVRTAHGAPESNAKGKQKIQVWLDEWVGCHLQQTIIAVSEDLAKKLQSSFSVAKIRVVHNGVDSEFLRANAMSAEFRIAEPFHKHIGIVGRIESVKRVDIFIRMAALVLNNRSLSSPLRFHVIGDGGLRIEMELLANKLGVADNILFHGHRNDIASCVGSLDAVVMCSDHEGTPMTALESLALGTPLIAHNVGGLHELLLNYPAFLVSDHSPEGYADALAAVMTISISAPPLASEYTAECNAINVQKIYRDTTHRQ